MFLLHKNTVYASDKMKNNLNNFSNPCQAIETQNFESSMISKEIIFDWIFRIVSCYSVGSSGFCIANTTFPDTTNLCTSTDKDGGTEKSWTVDDSKPTKCFVCRIYLEYNSWFNQS